MIPVREDEKARRRQRAMQRMAARMLTLAIALAFLRYGAGALARAGERSLRLRLLWCLGAGSWLIGYGVRAFLFSARKPVTTSLLALAAVALLGYRTTGG